MERLSPRTMLNVLLLCCGLLQGIQAILTTDLSCGHLQKVSGGLEGADRARYSGLLRKVKEVSAEPVGALPRLGLEQMALEVPEADGDLVQRGSTLEPQVTLPELSYRHPNEQGGLRPQQPSLCPWAQGWFGAQNGAAWEGTICSSPAGEQPGLGRAEAAQGCKRLRHSKEGGPSPHSCNPFN
ncbi:agouti-related protein isoform 3-T3 [Morphnus guianensis]